jgi:cyanate permease
VSVSTISYVVWAVIGVIALLLWWLSYLRPAAVAHPGQAVGKLATSPVVRVILVLGFMWLGWHLFAR